MPTLTIKGFDFLLDDDIFEWAQHVRWEVRSAPKKPSLKYLHNTTKGWLHRCVMELEGVSARAILVDHRDGNTFDCRRENLRLATPAQNCCNRVRSRVNTSGVKGVSWDKKAQKWEAYVKLKGFQKKVGRFATIEEAAQAVAKARAEMHGRFANDG